MQDFCPSHVRLEKLDFTQSDLASLIAVVKDRSIRLDRWHLGSEADDWEFASLGKTSDEKI